MVKIDRHFAEVQVAAFTLKDSVLLSTDLNVRIARRSAAHPLRLRLKDEYDRRYPHPPGF